MLQLQPFFWDTLPKISTFSHLSAGHKKLAKRKAILCAHPSQNPSYQHEKTKRSGQKLTAVVKEVGVDLRDGGDQSVVFGASNQEEVIEQRDVVSYDWTEEWYPLYLCKNVPDDAPLGLTVYDKQVVLYRDGTGELRCFEDRCPHR